MIISEQTLAIIKATIWADPNLSKEEKEGLFKLILSLVSGEKPKPRMGTKNEAMKILGVSIATMGRYVRAGKITPIRLSPRKVKFDLNEIERFAENGDKSLS